MVWGSVVKLLHWILSAQLKSIDFSIVGFANNRKVKPNRWVPTDKIQFRSEVISTMLADRLQKIGF